MTLNSVKYTFKEGLKNVWTNRLMSISSILVMICCLVLTGASILFSDNIRTMLKSIEGENSITIYLDKDVKYQDVAEIEDKIKSISNIATCTFYSKEEAVGEYQDMLGELFEELQGEENPLPDAFHITMKDLSKYDSTVKEISIIKGVSSMSDRSETASKLTSLYGLVTKIGTSIVILLSLVSLFIISNTIRVTMYSRRREITIMKSVGATNWFIRMPFIIEGITIGIISALISIEILKFTYENLINIITDVIPFKTISFDKVYLNILIGFLISGVVFGIIGGIISISRYLKKEGENVGTW